MPQCHFHPAEKSNIRCASCDRHICERDAVPSARGIQCGECAAKSASRAGTRYARASAAAALLAGTGGLIVAQALTRIPALWGVSFWVGVFFGALLGEVVRRASGGHRTHVLAAIAAGAAACGSLLGGLGGFGMLFAASTAVLFLKAGP